MNFDILNEFNDWDLYQLIDFAEDSMDHFFYLVTGERSRRRSLDDDDENAQEHPYAHELLRECLPGEEVAEGSTPSSIGRSLFPAAACLLGLPGARRLFAQFFINIDGIDSIISSSRSNLAGNIVNDKVKPSLSSLEDGDAFFFLKQSKAFQAALEKVTLLEVRSSFRATNYNHWILLDLAPASRCPTVQSMPMMSMIKALTSVPVSFNRSNLRESSELWQTRGWSLPVAYSSARLQFARLYGAKDLYRLHLLALSLRLEANKKSCRDDALELANESPGDRVFLICDIKGDQALLYSKDEGEKWVPLKELPEPVCAEFASKKSSLQKNDSTKKRKRGPEPAQFLHLLVNLGGVGTGAAAGKPKLTLTLSSEKNLLSLSKEFINKKAAESKRMVESNHRLTTDAISLLKMKWKFKKTAVPDLLLPELKKAIALLQIEEVTRTEMEITSIREAYNEQMTQIEETMLNQRRLFCDFLSASLVSLQGLEEKLKFTHRMPHIFCEPISIAVKDAVEGRIPQTRPKLPYFSTPSSPSISLQEVAPDFYEGVMQSLNVFDIRSLSLTCKRALTASKSPALWLFLSQRDALPTTLREAGVSSVHGEEQMTYGSKAWYFYNYKELRRTYALRNFWLYAGVEKQEMDPWLERCFTLFGISKHDKHKPEDYTFEEKEINRYVNQEHSRIRSPMEIAACVKLARMIAARTVVPHVGYVIDFIDPFPIFCIRNMLNWNEAIEKYLLRVVLNKEKNN